MVDRLVLEYKGSDLQPRWVAGPATAAERQEREAVHHTVRISAAIDAELPEQVQSLGFALATGSKTM